VATGLALALLLGGGLGVAAAEPPAQQRYLAQPGDSLDGVAALFGVDPTAIAAASGLTDGTPLQPAQIVVIPAPGQTPDDAARMAAGLEGTSPFAVGAHLVAPGETLAGIADRHGVTPQAIADLNGLAQPDVLGVGQRLLIPPPEGVGGPSPPAAGAAAVFVPGVPAYVQQRNLSCEYAAAYIATGTFGAGVPEAVFVESVPSARNPHWGYRGNIDGWWGNTDDYGVYAEALVPVLNASGYEAEVFYSGGDPDALRARLDAGRPVLTWLGYWGDTGVTFEDEGTYTVAAGMHVVVAYGYDDWGVHVSNPADGGYEYYPWADFGAMWSVLDGMGLAVAPAE
jgi:LysM repeat protein